MHRIAFVLALICIGLVVGLAQPSNASAGWCWPTCSSYGFVGPGTWGDCWYTTEVCSGWNYWSVNGESKTCYPWCDAFGMTSGQILYGFENWERVRGRFTYYSGTRHILPSDVAMGGYLRAQVSWWSGPASQLNAAAA